MGNLNKFIGIGRICYDPELKPVGDHTVLNNTLAMNESYKDRNGQKQERTEFLKCVFWNHPANIIHKYCRKGSQIFVEGSLQMREWQDKEGNKRFTTEVNVRNVQLLDSKSSENQQNKQGTDHYNQYQGNSQAGNNDFMGDESPF